MKLVLLDAPSDGLDREILALLERRAELRGERVDLVRALLDGRLERTSP